MKVDDITFGLFVNNGLSQAKMREVEKMLIEDNEADASLQACILNYSIHQELADELFGVENEKNIYPEDRISLGTDSRIANNGSLILKSTTMNNKLSKEEILKIQELVVTFNESCNAELSFEENLAEFYLTQRPGTSPEDAHEVVKGLKSGIDSFNSNLKKALEEGDFDYAAELKNISSELPLREKYELYVNFLAALQTLCAEHLSSEQSAQLEGFQTIRERLIVEGDVSEDMLADVEEKIALLLENNTLCLGSVESLKGLIGELPNGAEAIERAVAGSEQDMREKWIASMATYIAYRNENLESLRGQELTPEAVAISTAAGVEEMHVVEDLNAGRTTVDKAIRVLKIIGGVALFALLAYAAFTCIAAIGFMTAFGSTTIATIGAFAASLFVVWALSSGAFNAGEKILGWSSRIFDVVVNTWRETAWPAVKGVLSNTWNWFLSLFQRNTVVRQEQQSGNGVQTVPTV